MCIYYDSHGVKHYIGEKFKVEDPNQMEIGFSGSYKTQPGDKALAIYQEDGNRRAEVFEFGMMPEWGKPEDKQTNQWRFCNARDDKLLDSRMWPERFKRRRCLIPARGFFEPHQYPQKIDVPGGRKPTDSIPFYFRLKSTDIFAFAGIWDQWTNKETGETLKSFSIITTGPNHIIKKIHNKKPRTPVIIGEHSYDFWLGEVDRPENYYEAGIFEPWPDEDMEAWQVTKELDYGGTGPTLIEPVEDPVEIGAGQGGQESLF